MNGVSKINRVTVLLGAGAMMESTKISTSIITNRIISKPQKVYDLKKGQISKIYFLKDIYNRLTSYYAREKDIVSFEDVLHALEMLETLQTARKEMVVKEYRSVVGMFADLKQDYSKINDILIRLAIKDLISEVVQIVLSEELSWKNPEQRWFQSFFESLNQIPLDIFTLNYDSWLERILKNYNDGFIPICDSYSEFSAKHLFCDVNSTSINHLHGQIYFSFSKKENAKMRNGVFKKDKIEKGEEFWGTRRTTQSSDQIYFSPIITGLRKTDKISIPPYDAYRNHFYQSVLENRNLLIVGYGFGDYYINSIINQFRDFHGDQGKIIYISYLSDNSYFMDFMEMPIPSNFKHSIYSTFREKEIDTRFLALRKQDFVDSLDHNSRVYFCGFKKAAHLYFEDIMKMFS